MQTIQIMILLLDSFIKLVMVWSGLWLRDRKLRTLLRLSGRFAG
ncbi:hypothetical protein [Bradyrhizobium sp.]